MTPPESPEAVTPPKMTAEHLLALDIAVTKAAPVPLPVDDLVQIAVWQYKGAWIFGPESVKARGVKLVTLPRSEIEDYARVLRESNTVQAVLEAAPKSLRPRRKQSKPVVEVKP